MSQTRIHNLSISLDGFAAGEGQSLQTPMGHAGERLHTWMFATGFGASLVGGEAGSAGVDDTMARRHEPGIGAEIMGAGKFGPPGWQEDPDWRGWWGSEPPFHTPVLVLTHRPREPIEMAGGTTFHFLDAAPAQALDVARRLAGGRDVRIGGGASVAREFIAAGLVDLIHLVQVPIVLGRGARLWDGLEGIGSQYAMEAVSTPTGVTHLTFTKRRSHSTLPARPQTRRRSSQPWRPGPVR